MAFNVSTTFADARSAGETSLAAAIEALRAEFQQKRTQIEGQKGIAEANLGRSVSLLARQQGLAQDALTGRNLQRGILRSGIHAGDDARLRQGYAEQGADLQSQQASTMMGLEAALAALRPQEQAAVGQAKIDMQMRMASLAQALAELNALAPSAPDAPPPTTMPTAGVTPQPTTSYPLLQPAQTSTTQPSSGTSSGSTSPTTTTYPAVDPRYMDPVYASMYPTTTTKKTAYSSTSPYAN